MSDAFGHLHAIFADGTCVDGWGSGPFWLVTPRGNYRFCDSDRFGPALCDKHGDPVEKDLPGERSPFWRAYAAWRQQGRRLAEDGKTCIYEPLKPTKYRRVARGFSLVVEQGDEGGGYEEVP